MHFSDYEKLSYLDWLINTKRSSAQDFSEMHCCDSCKKYELNDGECTGWGIDSAEDNDCTAFVPER